MGGSGDYFDVADQVLMMDEYHLKDVTEEAKLRILTAISEKLMVISHSECYLTASH